jgi:uncharacterized membrane protein
MDPLVGLIDKTEEKLGHSPHPMIVALPLGAWCVSQTCDFLGLVTRDRSYDDAARISMGIGLVGAAGAVLTGLRDYSSIPRERPSHEVATRHALWNGVVGTLFTASYLLRQRNRASGRRTSLLARLLGWPGGSLALYTAWLGGELVEKYGEAVKPVMDQLEKAKEKTAGKRQQPRLQEMPAR